MERSISHFEIYAEDPSEIPEFYGAIFGGRVERIPGVACWRIFPHANENGRLHGGVTSRAICGLNRWLLYVRVASIGETVTLVRELGGSIARTKASTSI